MSPRRNVCISDEPLEALDLKAAAGLVKDGGRWRRLCSEVHAKATADRERHFNHFADEAKESALGQRRSQQPSVSVPIYVQENLLKHDF